MHRLLESGYEACLCHDLAEAGLSFGRQVALPVHYRGVQLECGYRMNLVVSGLVIVEVKSVERLLPIHDVRFLAYLRLSGLAVGLPMTLICRC